MKITINKKSNKKPFILRIVLTILVTYICVMFTATWWDAYNNDRSVYYAAKNLHVFYLLSAIVMIILTAFLIISVNRLIEDKFESERRRRLFADAMAHDMKTPLSIISNYAELIMDEKSEDSRRRYAQTIIDESVSMNDAVVTMLDLSMMEAGTYPMDLSDFDLTEIIRSDISRHKVLLDEKNMSIREEIPEDIIMFADRKLISMALSNFISNGIRYGREGTELTVSLTKDKNRIRISVFNVGNPIPDDEIRKIWDTFYSVNEGNARSSGLGLAVVRNICQMHGGEYGCSNKDGGVCFWFEIGSQEDRLFNADALTGPVINVTENRNQFDGVISIAIGTIIQGFFGIYEMLGLIYRFSSIGEIVKAGKLNLDSVILRFDVFDIASLAGMVVGSIIIFNGICNLTKKHDRFRKNKVIIFLTLLITVVEGSYAILSMTVLNDNGVFFLTVSIILSIALFVSISAQLIMNYLMISSISMEMGNLRRSRNLKGQICIITIIIAMFPVLGISNILLMLPWDVTGDSWLLISIFAAISWIRTARNR